jgi:hypothetical protein
MLHMVGSLVLSASFYMIQFTSMFPSYIIAYHRYSTKMNTKTLERVALKRSEARMARCGVPNHAPPWCAAELQRYIRETHHQDLTHNPLSDHLEGLLATEAGTD